MFATRTMIGLIVGSAIIGIGVYSLFTSFGFYTIDVDKTFEIGEAQSIKLPQIKALNNK